MRTYFLVLLATIALLVNSIQAVSVATDWEKTQLRTHGAIHRNNEIPIHDHSIRFLGTHKNEIVAGKDDTYDTESEERGLQYNTVQDIAKKLRAEAGIKWKTLTDKDFRNYKLFMGGASFEKLYKKGATPFKLFTQLGKNDIDKTTTRYYAYEDYWVWRNINKYAGTSTR
ncbi:Secreted RxLR effector peptide protein [Phytophthora palmivora]|uniref:RxLR effector protein n=1 Tax=Phytophthora palmivora TaxID=4796 RepID=A0A2P4XNS4_9STRA|nr:Secreted RxLR effector peptide protein [Phytophthora palmivora]